MLFHLGFQLFVAEIVLRVLITILHIDADFEPVMKLFGTWYSG